MPSNFFVLVFVDFSDPFQTCFSPLFVYLSPFVQLVNYLISHKKVHFWQIRHNQISPQNFHCASGNVNEEVMANRARFFNTMNNFLTWCALRPYIIYASKPFRKAHQDFVKGLMGGKVVDQRS